MATVQLRRLPSLVVAAVMAMAAAGIGAPIPPAPPPPPTDTGCYRGGPWRTGYFPNARLPKRPAVLWTYKMDATPYDPVVAGGVVFVGDSAGAVHAIRSDTGTTAWVSHDNERETVYSAVQVAGSRVYVTSCVGAEALDRTTGKLVWRFPVPTGAEHGAPLVLDARVFVGGSDGVAYCLDAATGEVVWRHEFLADAPPRRREPDFFGRKAEPRTAASDGERLFLPVYDQSRLLALDMKTGQRLWSHRFGDVVYGPPAISGGTVLVGDWTRRVNALERATGESAWQARTKDHIASGVACRADAAFVANFTSITRIDLKDRRLAWTYEVPPGPPGRGRGVLWDPLVTADGVVFTCLVGELFCVAADTGALHWRTELVPGMEVAETPCTDGERLFAVARGPHPRPGGALVAVGESPAAQPGRD